MNRSVIADIRYTQIRYNRYPLKTDIADIRQIRYSQYAL